MEVPRYSLAERDRRWALARQITAAENVQALIACGGPGCAGIPSASTASKGDALHHPTATRNDWPAQHVPGGRAAAAHNDRSGALHRRRAGDQLAAHKADRVRRGW